MTEKPKVTESGRPIIPVNLVGMTPCYKILKEPENPAYPKGDELQYSDDFTLKLTELYSLDDVFGGWIEGIKKRDGVAIPNLVMGSPLNSSEAESILAYMIRASVDAGSWQPFIIDVPHLTDTSIQTAKEYLERVEAVSPSYNRWHMNKGLLFAFSAAKEGGFTMPTECGSRVVGIPTQNFVEYCMTKKK